MTLATAGLHPSRIQREARTRASVAVYDNNDPVDTEHLPQFAFTTGSQRPTTWKTGRWDGTTAQTPVIGQAVSLAAGTHDVWLKLGQDVLPLGRIHIE